MFRREVELLGFSIFLKKKKMRRHKSYLPFFRSDLPVVHSIFLILKSLWTDTYSVCLCDCSSKCDYHRASALMSSHLKHQRGCFRQGWEGGRRKRVMKKVKGRTVQPKLWKQRAMNWFRHRQEVSLGCWINTDALWLMP